MTRDDAFRLRGAPIIHETIDDETIAINQLTGAYYSIGGPGAECWQMLAQGATRGQLVDRLAVRYDADRADLSAAVDAFLASLGAEEMLVPVAPSEVPARVPVEEGSGPPTDRRPFPGLEVQRYTDLETMLLADPIHEVDETGWPTPQANAG